MYDAVTWTAIPEDAQAVAGYTDGRYKWPLEAWQRFPRALTVGIDCFASTNVGAVLDMEWGDATPEECPGWLDRAKLRGITVPTIYCSLSRVGEVIAQCGPPLEAGYRLWIAHYTGIASMEDVPGCDAVQYADPDWTFQDYDLSIVSSAAPMLFAGRPAN